MTEMNVSATVGMSATVGEMSVTVGKCLQQWGKCLQEWEIEYGLENLRVEIVIHNFDRLPFRLYGITCQKPIKI